MVNSQNQNDTSAHTLTLLKNFLGDAEIERMLEDKSKREADILKVAIQLFAEKGFESTTTREIAKKAGIAEGTIFRYFKTKSDILLSIIATSIIKAATPRVFNPVKKILNQPEKPTRQILKELILDRIALVQENAPLLTVILTEIQYRPQLKQLWMQEFPGKGLKMLEEFVAGRIGSGEFRSDIPPVKAATYLAGMVGASALLELNMDWPDTSWLDDASIEHLLDLYLAGMKNRGDTNA